MRIVDGLHIVSFDKKGRTQLNVWMFFFWWSHYDTWNTNNAYIVIEVLFVHIYTLFFVSYLDRTQWCWNLRDKKTNLFFHIVNILSCKLIKHSTQNRFYKLSFSPIFNQCFTFYQNILHILILLSQSHSCWCNRLETLGISTFL